MGAERERVADFGKLENGLRQAGDWYRWGPYVSERQWGTVREVNPPVQAWAALEVFAVDEGRDTEFLSCVFDKLLVNFTWWVNLEDAGGRNVYEGGFLGLDNIGPLDRSRLPVGGVLEQSDATGWMGFYAIALSGIATALSRTGQRPMSDLLVKFMEHFAAIRDALDSQGLWDSDDGFYYDRLVTPSGEQVPIRVRSMVGMIPLLAAAVVSEDDLQQALVFGKQFADLLGREGLVDAGVLRERGVLRELGGQERLLLSLAGPDRLARHRTAPARGTAPRKPAGPRDLRQPPGAKTGRPHRTTAGDQATQDRPGPPTGQDYVLLVHRNGA